LNLTEEIPAESSTKASENDSNNSTQPSFGVDTRSPDAKVDIGSSGKTASNCDDSQNEMRAGVTEAQKTTSSDVSLQTTPRPSPKWERVTRPPGGETSDIFNINSTPPPQPVKSTTTPTTARSVNRNASESGPVPWGTEEDMKKLPTQSIPSLKLRRSTTSAVSRPLFGVGEQRANQSDAASSSSSAVANGGPKLKRTQSGRMSAPYGTDENYTQISARAKHANHKTMTPWAIQSESAFAENSKTQSGGTSTGGGEGKKDSRPNQNSISQIPF